MNIGSEGGNHSVQYTGNLKLDKGKSKKKSKTEEPRKEKRKKQA